ncbi:multidrug ABC transporter [Jeotgalibacillus malaysiensis]|uniref:Multidrug ABC transporter n=1 Tax=Jeotgalibacillus malaysiensis TaxID=1508404 RepID=A0A0B5AVQ7_9BACL|nr:ABC transporter ATP-binding protein [Jeotgalibacillus malaysiensis]AJD92688.1 multidrug ABC transporter [Jeotgalibacillus malaysiensis]
MKEMLYFLKEMKRFAGRTLYINISAMIIIGLLEGAAIVMLIPMIGLTGIIPFDSSVIPFAGWFDFLGNMPIGTSLLLILSAFLVLAASQYLLHREVGVRNAVIYQGFLKHLRVKTYRELIRSNWLFFISNRRSDLVNALAGEVMKASSGTQAVLQFASSIITTAFQVVLAFILAPVITAFVLLFGGALVFFNRKFLKKSLALGKRNYELQREYMAGITDQMNGMKEIKSNSLESSRLNWFEDLTERMKKEQTDYSRLRATSQTYYKIASSVLIAIFIYVAIMVFSAQLAQLMLIMVIFSRLWPRVAGIQASLEQIATVLPSFKGIQNLQQKCHASAEVEAALADYPALTVKESMKVEDVSFKYQTDQAAFTLQNISITVRANEMTAFVGRSGAGKSTLVDLLMGLNIPDEGRILVDGETLTPEKIQSLRKTISYVPQDPFLFNTSIRSNLLLVKGNATDEELWEALTFASADGFVSRLPEGLDTLIGDRGIKLSGGERQRIVLARAILRKPSVLVLDEATSSLDADSEASIQQAIEKLKGKMTILVIAHRLSTIRNADQVIVLDQGEVIQQGGFKQLAQEKTNLFSHLLQKQMGAS